MKIHYDKYISTTLPYANSKPHIGHALEFIQADALTRYFKIMGDTVFLNIGVDEHGLKVYNKAQELGIPVQQYLDKLAEDWKSFCELFQISYDNFYRTTDPEHVKKVQEFWNNCLAQGYLYEKTYTGNYCTGCESFKTDTDLVDGLCPDHRTAPTSVSETNWFFRVSKFRKQTLEWLDSNPNFLVPHNKINELRNVIKNAEDISVSRLKESAKWGIEVPNDHEQVIYVWFEALLNYIFATPDSYKEFIQICGPDNLRFQGCLFQVILEYYNAPHTDRLLVHGTILDANGTKMSKSLGNVIDPVEQVEKYGLDAVKYYALAGLSTTGNANWDEEQLVKLYNTELVGELGNLVARALHLIDISGHDVQWKGKREHKDKNGFISAIEDKLEEATKHWQSLNINLALRETNAIVKLCNKYINDTKPWANNDVEVLEELYFALVTLSVMYQPVLDDDTYNRLHNAIADKKKIILFNKL